MAVEVRDLIIKASVTSGSSSNAETGRISVEEKQELVAECIEQLLEILRDREEL